ncbi:callose synthase 9-like isoform X4 [Malus sylvestris]|nr:callose synthase 9-like isoform X4 [Malus sylvestris]
MSELEKGAVKAVQDLYDVVHHDILSMDLRKNYETWELLSNARTEGRVFAKLKWPKDRVVIKDMQGAQVKNCIHCVDALLNERPKRKDRFNLK